MKCSEPLHRGEIKETFIDGSTMHSETNFSVNVSPVWNLACHRARHSSLYHYCRRITPKRPFKHPSASAFLSASSGRVSLDETKPLKFISWAQSLMTVYLPTREIAFDLSCCSNTSEPLLYCKHSSPLSSVLLEMATKREACWLATYWAAWDPVKSTLSDYRETLPWVVQVTEVVLFLLIDFRCEPASEQKWRSLIFSWRTDDFNRPTFCSDRYSARHSTNIS